MFKRKFRPISVFTVVFIMATAVIGIVKFNNPMDLKKIPEPKELVDSDKYAHSPFTSSYSYMTNLSNEYWTIYGTAEGIGDSNSTDNQPGRPDIRSVSYGGNTDWNEIDSVKFAWTNYNGMRNKAISYFKTTKINGLNRVTGVQPNGFIWSWANLETWPDAANHHNGLGSFHFDQLPHYMNALYNYYMWSRDMTFLDTYLPKAEYVMDNYLLGTMLGNIGVAIIPGAANNGTSTSRASNYMDEVRFGYKDAWLNSTFYMALVNMAELEDVKENTAKRDIYQNLVNAFSAKYDTEFWNSSTNRYIGWRDSNGAAHDSGYTYVNLQALANGLGNVDKASKVFNWLNSPASPTVGGAHKGSTNVYQNVFGPRNNTSPISNPSEWDGWSDPTSGKVGYGDIVEDGGAALFVSYYDIMARLKYSNADDAMIKYKNMLERVTSESKKLTFNGHITPVRAYNDFGENWVEIGTSEPFPESGMSITPFVYGFMGLQPKKNGLNITPNLPVAFVYTQASDVFYGSTGLTVKTSRGDILAEQTSNNGGVNLGASGSLAQTFTTADTFNEVSLFVGNYSSTTAAFNIQLDKSVEGVWTKWTKVATKRFVNIPNNFWLSLAAPDQEAGTYRITITNPSGGTIAWYRDSASTYSDGTAYQNGAAITGDFMFRVINAWQTNLIDLSTGTIADKLTSTLGQTFFPSAPFDRLSMRIGTYRGTAAGFTARLMRDVGGDWQEVFQQTFTNVKDNADVTLNFSDQPAGKYMIEIFNPVHRIAWWRNATDVYGSDDLYAMTNGIQVAGDRDLKVYRGKYKIEIPLKSINTTINSGDTCVIP